LVVLLPEQAMDLAKFHLELGQEATEGPAKTEGFGGYFAQFGKIQSKFLPMRIRRCHI